MSLRGVLPEEWIAEPCEHCGSDIDAVEYQQQFDEMSLRQAIFAVPLGGYYVLEPCGHIMLTIEARKVS